MAAGLYFIPNGAINRNRKEAIWDDREYSRTSFIAEWKVGPLSRDLKSEGGGSPQLEPQPRHGLILIVPVLLVRECAVSFTAQVPGAMVFGSRKITWVKIEPGVVRTSSAVRL